MTQYIAYTLYRVSDKINLMEFVGRFGERDQSVARMVDTLATGRILCESAPAAVGLDALKARARVLVAKDFGFYLQKIPACIIL